MFQIIDDFQISIERYAQYHEQYAFDACSECECRLDECECEISQRHILEDS